MNDIIKLNISKFVEIWRAWIKILLGVSACEYWSIYTPFYFYFTSYRNIVIYKALCFDVAQAEWMGHPMRRLIEIYQVPLVFYELQNPFNKESKYRHFSTIH